ncbi:MAG TPA: 8-oxo-dGTP diphosphatase MutT [Symbiobacteriaceae bacterium]|nr:8-oxo-dGTP diphosphatase MutT [Symbiobacteriaceae bacterium]
MKHVDVVGAVIRNAAGEVLCALRAPDMAMAGLWEFPGGKIEPGEAPPQTLRREIAEELGCQIDVGELIADVTHAYPTVEVRLLTYEARVTNGTPTAKEHAELRWVSLKDLPTLTWAPADIPTVQKLTARQPESFTV